MTQRSLMNRARPLIRVNTSSVLTGKRGEDEEKDMNIDCIIIGHNELNFSSVPEEAEASRSISGNYWAQIASSVDYMGRRMPYDELLNNYLAEKKGKESNLHIYKTPSLGVRYLVNFLKKRNFDVEHVNSFTQEKQRLASLLKHNPESVAITTPYYTWSSPVTDIVRFVKQHNKDTRIIAGGPHIYSTCSHISNKRQDSAFREIGADIYVNDSQGELTLSRILGALKQTSSPDLSSIPNLFSQREIHFVEQRGCLNKTTWTKMPWIGVT